MILPLKKYFQIGPLAFFHTKGPTYGKRLIKFDILILVAETKTIKNDENLNQNFSFHS